MIHQISGFAEEQLAIVVFGFDHEFNGFLTDFLSNLVDAPGQELAGITFFAGAIPTMLNGSFQVIEKLSLVSFSPAGIATGVTGGAIRTSLNEKAVFIAVRRNANKMEVIFAGFTLCPEPLLRAAEEGNLTRRQGLIDRFLIHISLHQHHSGGGVLYDGREKTVRALGKIQLRNFVWGYQHYLFTLGAQNYLNHLTKHPPYD